MIGNWTTQIVALLRHLRAERTMVVTVTVLVCLTSLVMATIPRLYTQMLDDELTYRMENASDAARNFSVSIPDRFARGSSDDDKLREKGDNYQANLPESIRQIVSGNEYVVDTQNFTLLPATQPNPGFLRGLRLRLMSNVVPQIHVTHGRLPSAGASKILLSEWKNVPGARGEPYRERIGVAISEPAAAEMGLEVNELTRIIFGTERDQALIHVTGVFTVNDPDASFWNGDTWLTNPVIYNFGSDFGQTLVGAALIAPEDYDRISGLFAANMTYTWNFYVDASALSTANYRTVVAEARQVQLTKGPTDEILPRGHERIVVANDLPRLLNDFALQTNVTLTVIALSAVGLLVTGAAALALLAALITDRRRTTIALVRGRGASSAQLLTAQCVEGVILCVPAASLGYVLALLLVDTRSNAWSIVGSLAVAIVTIALLVLASRVNISVALGSILSRAGSQRSRLSPRRLAAEGAVVLLAAAGIYLLRRRGLAPNVTAEGDVTFDPFLAAVPILLTLAVGLAALRLYPLVMRLSARIAGAGRGLVTFVGLRRVSGQSPVTHLPLLVMLLAIGISIFTSIVRFSISEAQANGAWQRVGAPYRVETGDSAFPDRLDLRSLDGVTTVAEVFVAPIKGGTLFAIETNELDTMNHGTRGDEAMPSSMFLIPVGPGLGTELNPLPAIVSAPNDESITVGKLLTISVPAQPTPINVAVRVAAIRPAFAGIPDGSPSFIVNLPALREVMAGTRIRTNLAFVDAEGLTADQLDRAISAQVGNDERVAGGVSAFVNTDVVSRAETYVEIRDAPLSRGVTRSFALSVGMAALYAILAIVTALTLTARARARDLSYLRTLGLSQAQALRLAIIEQIPAVLAASVIGAALGIAIVRLIEPGLDVSAFVGPHTSVPLQTDWLSISLITFALTVATIATIALYTALNRRTQISKTLRVGEE